MTRRRMFLYISFITIVLLSTLSLIKSLTPKYELIITNEEQQKEVKRIDIEKSDYLTIQYIHSYERDLNWDFYKIIPPDFQQVGTAFTFFSYDSRNSTFEEGFELEAGTGKIVSMDKNYNLISKELGYRVGHTVPQWLLINGDIFQLQALGKPGERLLLTIEKK